MDEKKRPIGVFDSGTGGLSVLKELVNLMPGEDYIYYGDSLNAPYGTKSEEEVRRLSFECADHLRAAGVKEIVIACNTATGASVLKMRDTFTDMPIIGIEPAIKPAVMDNPGKKILVMATPLTIKQEKFRVLMDEFADRAQIIPLPCPGLMEFVEQGMLEGEELDKFLKKLLEPYQNADISAAVLGCTHYPLVKRAVGAALGSSVRLYDGGEGTARQARHLLEENGLLSGRPQGSIIFRSSEDGKGEFYEELFMRAVKMN